MATKIHLTQHEKDSLYSFNEIDIERQCKIPCPNSSIVYGIGNKYIWDKIERIWVYGDVDKYISDNKNVGRRAIDYKDNTRNMWSGSHWYEFLGRENDDFGNIGKVTKNGIKNIVVFEITNITVSDLPLSNPENEKSTRKIKLKIRIKKIPTPKPL